MEDSKSPPVEKRAVIMCLDCDQWKMGGVKTRLCADCFKKRTSTQVWDGINWTGFWKNFPKGDDDD